MAKTSRERRHHARKASAGRDRLSKLRGWLVGVLAAALAAASAGVLTGWFEDVGRAITGSASPAQSAAVPNGSASTTAHDPLTVAVEARTAPCDSAGWVVAAPPGHLQQSAPANTDMLRSWRDWPPAKTGINASPGGVLIFVQGRSDAEVVLTDFTIRVHERRPPPTGTLLRASCGDVGAFRWLEVDLDHDPPRPVPGWNSDMAEFAKGDVPDWQLKPIKFPYEVSVTDAEPFFIQAHTKDCDCSWTAELTWASEGRTGTTVIDDHGTPFRTTSTRNVAGRCLLTPGEIDCR